MMTPEQIRAIQEEGYNWRGEPLGVDGKIGPETQWWLGILSLSVERRTAIVMLLGYYRDKKGEDPKAPPNRGTWVDSLVKPGGIGLGHPWCVALTSHVMRHFYSPSEWPYHMSTLKLLEWARKEGRIVKDPLPGDIVAFMYDHEKGHSEFNLASNPTWVLDIGGNIGNKMQVGKRARNGLTFIRTFDEPTALTCPPLESIINLDGTGTR